MTRFSPSRFAVATGALLLLVGALVAVSLAVGARPIPVDVVWKALTASDLANGDHLVVLERIPRTVDALVVGAALGLAGASMQGVTRNPLADPGILGVNAGAAGAVVASIGFLGVTSLTGLTIAGTVGALAAFVMVYAIAAVSPGGAQPVTLAIAGAATNAGLASLMSAVLVMQPDILDRFRYWQAGVLGVRGVTDLPAALPLLVVGALLCLAGARTLNLLALGDDAAAALGTRVGLARAVAALGGTMLAGTATAMVGPIGFVGLVVPHVLRMTVGGDYRTILPLSMLAGPALLLLADTTGRVVLPPSEIQVGVMAAVVGAPFMILLLRSKRRMTL